jgi:hypothetical protein
MLPCGGDGGAHNISIMKLHGWELGLTSLYGLGSGRKVHLIFVRESCFGFLGVKEKIKTYHPSPCDMVIYLYIPMWLASRP